MGKNDVVMKRWLSNPERFADFVNGALFRGQQVFSAEKLKKEEREQSIVFKRPDGREVGVQKYRDITMISEDGTRVVVLACENQEEIHYARPVRGMLYDALNYAEQIQGIRAEHRNKKDLKKSAEFLSGLDKTDRLIPIIMIVFYYGEEEWDGKKDLHGLLGIEHERYRILKKYVPNYKINLIDPRKLEDLKCFKTDLQMVFGMLKYKNSKVQMKEFVNKNKAFFSQLDEDMSTIFENVSK